jgi:hypothetical protein
MYPKDSLYSPPPAQGTILDVVYVEIPVPVIVVVTEEDLETLRLVAELENAIRDLDRLYNR